MNLAPVNPVAKVSMPDGDTRRERRAATADDARQLLQAAPMPRRLFYLFCMMTGYRFCETRRVKWGHVDLGNRPFVQLPMAQTKDGKLSKRKRRERWDVEIPLHPTLVAALKAYKSVEATPTDYVFKGTPILRTFKADLQAAGIAYLDERDRQLDRHALARTTFRTWLTEYGVHPPAPRCADADDPG